MKYIIIGAVAGGASTAARLRRLDEHAEIVIFEKGEYISYANCGLPYYIGNVIKERDKLFVQTASSFNKRFNIDVRIKSEVTGIDSNLKQVHVLDHNTGKTYSETYDKLVLSPGADPIRPPLPGINMEGIFTLRNVNDTDYIKAYADQYQSGKAVIIGAGFIGLEMAENLYELGMDVSIVEMGNQVMAPLDFPLAAIVQQHIRSKGIDLRLSSKVTGFEKSKENRINVMLEGNDPIEADIVILSIGVKPDTRLAQNAGLDIGEARGIKVNEYLQTSNPDIYAVGDAIEFLNPISNIVQNTFLAGPANKQGRICANNIVHGNTQKYKGAINTGIVKIFDLTVGTSGVASKHLQRAGIDHLVSTTHSGSHAGYYPGSKQISIQLQFSPDNGRLLGAQAVGYKGVDKRLDVLASAIRNGDTVFDLAEFEHSYAPPYSSAKDPVNMAGFVGDNLINDQLKVVYWDSVMEEDDSVFLLDVRNPEEHSAGNIPGSVNISIDELRSRLDEIPRNKKIIIFCQIGLRGYLAYRILKQNGYKEVYSLSGGYYTWKACASETSSLALASTSNLL